MAGSDVQGPASGPVCTAANPFGEANPTSPLVQTEGKKIADQVIARQKNGTPNSSLSANAAGTTNINACSRPRPHHAAGELRPGATPSDPYCVGGKAYMNSEQIPGNEPVPLQDGAGQAVLGSDRKPVYGPSRGVPQLGPIANKIDGDSYFDPWSRKADLTKMSRARPWDFQRMKDDDGSIIFTDKYTEFANIAIGYVDANHDRDWYPGFGDESTESVAEQYLKKDPSKFRNEPMDKKYPHVPIRIMRDFEIGRNLRRTLPPKVP